MQLQIIFCNNIKIVLHNKVCQSRLFWTNMILVAPFFFLFTLTISGSWFYCQILFKTCVNITHYTSKAFDPPQLNISLSLEGRCWPTFFLCNMGQTTPETPESSQMRYRPLGRWGEGCGVLASFILFHSVKRSAGAISQRLDSVRPWYTQPRPHRVEPAHACRRVALPR